MLLTPPDAAEVAILNRGVVSAVSGPSGLTQLQDLVIRAMFHSMTGFDVDTACQPITPEQFATDLARRNAIFRTRIVQVMLLAAFVVRPLPPFVAQQLRALREYLGPRDKKLRITGVRGTSLTR